MSTQATPAPRPRLPRAVALRLPAVSADWGYAAALALALVWIAIRANGGLRVADTSTVEVVIDLAAGVIAALALLTIAAWRSELPATLAAGGFALFVLASAVSTIWSVAPDQSWIEVNRLISYLAAFAAGMALARLAPERWAAVLGGVTLAAVAVSAWAVMHKVFPAWLEPGEVYARLREPFGYWNAVGLMAALGVPGCLWLGARRTGRPALSALAYPATALLIVAIMLSYSRGALLALVVGLAFWFWTVPLRLRGLAVLAVSIAGAGLVMAWDFNQVALSKDRVPLELRDQAGHQLGVALGFTLLALLVVGLALGFRRDRAPLSPRTRRRVGLAVLAALALVPLAGVAGLAASDRGLSGSISHGWTQLTDPNATQPSNQPGRLTAVGSVRARYWNDALKIFEAHPALGVGLGGYQLARLRIRTDTLDVVHAHGFVVQVLADRGLVGYGLSLLALVLLALAIAVTLGLQRRRRRGAPPGAERIALLTLTTTLVVFGVHSFVDWTWSIPGVTVPVLLAGGWLAARGGGDLARVNRISLRDGVRSRRRTFLAAGAIVLALVGAWSAWQPQRSLEATNQALDQLAADPPQIGTARRLAAAAHHRNPLAVDPLFVQAAIERKAHNRPGAQRALEAAVRLQPANPATWNALAEFQLHELRRPGDARKTLSAALYLDPKDVEATQLLLEVNRTATATS